MHFRILEINIDNTENNITDFEVIKLPDDFKSEWDNMNDENYTELCIKLMSFVCEKNVDEVRFGKISNKAKDFLYDQYIDKFCSFVFPEI